MTQHPLAVLLLAATPFAAVGQDLQISTKQLPPAIVDKLYDPPPVRAFTSGRCHKGDVRYSIVKGELPDGIEMSFLGQFSGIPSKAGTSEFVLRAEHACGIAERAMALVVTGAPLLRVEPAELRIECDAGGVCAKQGVVQVRGSWPRQPYQIFVEKPGWLTFSPVRGSSPTPGASIQADSVTFSANPKSLAPGEYINRVRFVTAQGTNAPEVLVRLTVKGVPLPKMPPPQSPSAQIPEAQPERGPDPQALPAKPSQPPPSAR